MGRLPKAPFEKILRESGKDVRASDSAAQALAEIAEDLVKELAQDAAELARHAGRKTILEEDVRLARKRK